MKMPQPDTMQNSAQNAIYNLSQFANSRGEEGNQVNMNNSNNNEQDWQHCEPSSGRGTN